MLGCWFSFEAYAKNVREKANKCSLKTTEVLLLMDMFLPKFIFIKLQQLQIVLRARQTLDVLVFYKSKFCLMSGLNFTLPDVASFLPENVSGLKRKLHSGLNLVLGNTKKKIWIESGLLLSMSSTV